MTTIEERIKEFREKFYAYDGVNDTYYKPFDWAGNGTPKQVEQWLRDALSQSLLQERQRVLEEVRESLTANQLIEMLQGKIEDQKIAIEDVLSKLQKNKEEV